MSSSNPQEPDQLVGQQVGNYRVTRLIGRGGMGSVYEAIHEQINRRAAIKVLNPETNSNPELGKRFINEARAVNQISHPGIVQVFDFGALQSGEPYIAMEYLEGETLSVRIERLGKLAERDAVRIGRQLASAISAAHEKQIIHRDLKPDNVILVADKEAQGRERAKVLDFGIAKISTPGGGKGTRTHAILGTAPYMSPEQCRGSSQITDRTDVYALGIILYESLTGSPPFVAEEDVEIMTMHLKAPLPSLRKAAPWVSKSLEELLSKMLAKAPIERPTMAQVAESFEQLFPGSLSGTLPILTPEPPAAPAGPRRLFIAGGAGVLLCLGLVAAFLLKPGQAPKSGELQAPIGVPPPSISDPSTAAVQPVPAPSSVTWELSSEPEGATVLDGATKADLGKTPWRHQQPASNGERKLLLKKNGYEPAEVVFSAARGEQKHVKLRLKLIDL